MSTALEEGSTFPLAPGWLSCESVSSHLSVLLYLLDSNIFYAPSLFVDFVVSMSPVGRFVE